VRATTLRMAVVLLVGCGGQEEEAGRRLWPENPAAGRVDLVLQTARLAEEVAEEQTRHTVETTARFFGHDPSVFAGMRVVVQDDYPECPGVSTDALDGCYLAGDFNTATVRMRSPYPGRGWNIEDTALPHELLHALIGDPTHSRPEWQQLPELQYLLWE